MALLALKHKTTTLAMSALIIFSTTVGLAGKDGVSGGGVITKSGDLLDFAEAQKGQGLVPFVPIEYSPKLSTKIGIIINRVLSGDVSFGKKLMNTIFGKNKTWYFTNTILTHELPTKNLHILLDNKTHKVVAKQDHSKIVIYKPWFDSKLNGNQEDILQAVGLIIHEAVMDTVLSFGMDHDLVRKMVRVIFAEELGGQFPTNNFVNILKVNGFFPTIYDDKASQVSYMLNRVNRVESLINERKNFSTKEWNVEKSYLTEASQLDFKELDPTVRFKYHLLIDLMRKVESGNDQINSNSKIEAIKKHLNDYLASFK